MKKQTAFDRDPVTLDEYWNKLMQHLQQEQTAVIICTSGRRHHWTCVKAITPQSMILSDSSGLRLIHRHHCNIGGEVKNMYTL